MVSISDEAKELYKEDGIRKRTVIWFSENGVDRSGVNRVTTFEDDNGGLYEIGEGPNPSNSDNICILDDEIELNSLSINESIMDSNYEFVGCIAATCEVTIYGPRTANNFKKKMMDVFQILEGGEELRLFRGYVDSAKTVLESTKKVITAYDPIYKKTNDVDVAEWYNGLTFPITIKDFRDSFFNKIGLTQETTTLINDDITIEKQYEPEKLKALDVLKSICQLNAVFGKCTRKGKFVYKSVVKANVGGVSAYPGNVYPNQAYPSQGGSNRSRASSGNTGNCWPANWYVFQGLQFEEYTVKAISKVAIRQYTNDPEITYGDGNNKYIIQGNMFTLELSDETKQLIAERIYNKVKSFKYVPFDVNTYGVPFMEPGDNIAFYVHDRRKGEDVIKGFTIMKRVFKGTQHLTDSFESDGDEDQKEFVSDLNVSINTIEHDIEDLYNDYEDLYDDYEDLYDDYTDFKNNALNVEFVTQTPSSFTQNTLYFVRKGGVTSSSGYINANVRGGELDDDGEG